MKTKSVILYCIVAFLIPTVYLSGMLLDVVEQNKVKTVEILNLRGYKYAFIEHFDSCKCHKNCYRMPNTK